MFIILTGMPNCGKSSVGKILSGKIGCPFFDTDEEILKKTGYPPRMIYQTKGADFFRLEEYSVFYNLLNYKADGQITLISSGGGLADNAKAIVFLQECMQKSKVLMCYLYAEKEILFQRILKKFYAEKTFPAFLGGADCKKEAEKQFEELYFRRTEVYKKNASFMIDTKNLSIKESSEKTHEAIKQIIRF